MLDKVVAGGVSVRSSFRNRRLACIESMSENGRFLDEGYGVQCTL